MCRRALLTKTCQPAITASQLKDNVSRGLHHRDRRSVSWCMSACTFVISVLLYGNLHHRDRRSVFCCMATCTIVIVDPCLVVCQKIQYKLLYEVILEAYSSVTIDQCVVVCQSTPSWLGINVLYVHRRSTSSFTRSFSRPTPVVTPDWPWDSWTASFLQTLTSTNPTRGSTTNSRYGKDNIVCSHGGAKGLCVLQMPFSRRWTELFLPLSKQNNIKINRSLVWRFGAASVIT